MKGMRDGTQTAASPVLAQFNGDFEFLEVLEVKGSCSSSVRMS